MKGRWFEFASGRALPNQTCLLRRSLVVKEQLKVASVSNDHLPLRWQYSYPQNQDYGRKKATEGRNKLAKENIRICMLS